MSACVRECVCVCGCVRACVRACVRVCMCVRETDANGRLNNQRLPKKYISYLPDSDVLCYIQNW